MNFESLKSFARSTWPFSEFFYLLKVISDAPLRDWTNFEKLNLFRQTYPYTMVRYARLTNAYELARQVEVQKTSGAVVECGVWRGGCSATMAYVNKRAGSDREFWLFDSFEGLPPPVEKDGDTAWGHVGDYAAPQQAAEEIFFSKLKINPRNVHIIKGWFQDTLPDFKDNIGPIAILRLDGDLYESTKVCLEYLYNQVVSGGFVIIDDYGCWQGSKTAVDEFFSGRDIQLQVIDKKGRYFQKS